MRILCLTSRLPYPPNRGDRLRAFHFIEHLSREHELHLASFIASEQEREYVPPLRDYCNTVHTVVVAPIRSVATVAANVWRRQPLQVLYYRSRRMQRLVNNILSSIPFDAAYVHLFRMAPYVSRRRDLYRIVDLTDVISEEIGRSLAYRGPVSRIIYQLEHPRIRRYERWLAETFEETWLISAADREVLVAEAPRANIRVIPNGVDTDQFRPTGQRPDSDSLAFVGHMGVPHNVDAVRHLAHDILPLVRRQVPAAKLRIVGAEPIPEVERLAEKPGVTVTGYVPDLNGELNRAAVFAAPLRFAAGVQNKVLEAMAAARPVVTTSLVNDGLRAAPGRDLLVADDPQSIAQSIITLLRDESLGRRIGGSARAFVQQKYTWEHALRRTREIEAEIS